jgi:hypothetical protein
MFIELQEESHEEPTRDDEGKYRTDGTYGMSRE